MLGFRSNTGTSHMSLFLSATAGGNGIVMSKTCPFQSNLHKWLLKNKPKFIDDCIQLTNVLWPLARAAFSLGKTMQMDEEYTIGNSFY